MFPTDSSLESSFTFETNATPLADDLPFHILMLGNWSGNLSRRELSQRRPVVIDRDNFDEVLRQFQVGLEIDIYGDGKSLLPLKFTELDDFHPDNLFQQISLFSDLRDIRRRLSNSESFNSAANEVRSWGKTPAEKNEAQTETNVQPQTIQSDSLLEDILSGSSSISSQKSGDSELSRFVSNIVSPFLIQIDENEQSQLIAVVDEAISQLMRIILHHPDFQELESAWRGLYFLVRRTETDVDLKIFILDISKGELSDNLKSVNSLADSMLYLRAVTETLETPGGQPFSVIGANYSFGVNVEDIATLIRISQIAAVSIAPFISYIKPEMFGIQSFGVFSDTSAFKFSAETNEGKLWNALRAAPESNYLALSPMRCVARMPYGNAFDSTEVFAFEEFTAISNHDHFLWMNPCFIVALLLAQSYRRLGWDMESHFFQDVEKLPLIFYSLENETKAKPCAEIVLTENILEKILEQGLLSLVSYRDTDRIRLPRFQSVSFSSPKLAGRWNI